MQLLAMTGLLRKKNEELNILMDVIQIFPFQKSLGSVFIIKI